MRINDQHMGQTQSWMVLKSQLYFPDEFKNQDVRERYQNIASSDQWCFFSFFVVLDCH